eukprot:TRINITY_DN525_c0_g2_i12.p1 TRINITY_DN525_c0_g2~~TRINITY_DN525_c0_g2_i12.p1  ORF type:complete len:615 (-),score=138.69 TRINITY_DN525_c0_g2_i12:704-2548(-)
MFSPKPVPADHKCYSRAFLLGYQHIYQPDETITSRFSGYLLTLRSSNTTISPTPTPQKKVTQNSSFPKRNLFDQGQAQGLSQGQGQGQGQIGGGGSTEQTTGPTITRSLNTPIKKLSQGDNKTPVRSDIKHTVNRPCSGEQLPLTPLKSPRIVDSTTPPVSPRSSATPTPTISPRPVTATPPISPRTTNPTPVISPQVSVLPVSPRAQTGTGVTPTVGGAGGVPLYRPRRLDSSSGGSTGSSSGSNTHRGGADQTGGEQHQQSRFADMFGYTNTAVVAVESEQTPSVSDVSQVNTGLTKLSLSSLSDTQCSSPSVKGQRLSSSETILGKKNGSTSPSVVRYQGSIPGLHINGYTPPGHGNTNNGQPVYVQVVSGDVGLNLSSPTKSLSKGAVSTITRTPVKNITTATPVKTPLSVGKIGSAQRPISPLDDQRLIQRQKQVDYGYRTVGYLRYRLMVSKEKRKPEHPRTPKKTQGCSKRSWDGQLKKWRRDLHLWDPENMEDFKSYLNTDFQTIVKNHPELTEIARSVRDKLNNPHNPNAKDDDEADESIDDAEEEAYTSSMSAADGNIDIIDTTTGAVSTLTTDVSLTSSQSNTPRSPPETNHRIDKVARTLVF